MENKILTLDGLKVAAFDWDNTLACTRKALEYTVNLVLPEYSLPLWNEVKSKRDRNLSFRDNFPLIFGKCAGEAYEKYRLLYKQSARELVSRPEKAEETMFFLRAHGVKIVIVSNKDRELLEYELPFLYDRSLFDGIVCGHEAPADKPQKEQLEYAVKSFGVKISPQTVWMVGDSLMDSRCALSAGARAVRIGEPIWEVAEDRENPEIVFVESFLRLYELLTEN